MCIMYIVKAEKERNDLSAVRGLRVYIYEKYRIKDSSRYDT